MKIKVLLAFLIAYNFSFAQSLNWTWAKNSSVYFNSKQDVTAVDNSGNVYLIGDFILPSVTFDGTTLTNTSDSNYSDAYILKYNSTGTLLWSKQLGGSRNENIASIDTDNAGNVYITGSFENNITLGNTTLSSTNGGVFISKLNSNGDYIWAIKNTGTNENFHIRDIKADNSGNVFITGETRSTTLSFDNLIITTPSNDPTLTNDRVFIVKFDTNGIGLWGKTGIATQSNVFGTIPRSIAPDNTGGVAVCGMFAHNTLSFDSIVLTKTTQNNNSLNMFVAKLDSNGNTMWAYNAGTIYQNSTIANAVSVDSNGNVYVGGAFPNTVSFGNISLNSYIGAQLFLVKYNASGTVLWAKTSGYITNGYTTIRTIDTDENNNVYVGGLTFATTIDFTNNVTLTNLGNSGAFFVTKYDSSGIPSWSKGVTNFNANNDISIDCKSEDDLFIGGFFNTNSLQLGTIQLTKTNANSDIFVGRLNNTSLNTSEFTTNLFSVSPNPTKNILNIKNLKTNSVYTLYSISGQTIKQGILFKDEETLYLNELLSGLYILKITDPDGNTNQKKVIIQ